MIATSVGTLERSWACFVNAGLEALGCQDGDYLVLNLPSRGMAACYLCGLKVLARVHKNLFRPQSRDGNLHGSGMSHATTASPKPFFRTPWKVGDAVVGRGNAGWTKLKNNIPVHAGTELSALSMPELLTRTSSRKVWKWISAESSNQSVKGLTRIELNNRIWSPKDESDFVTCVSH